MTTPLDSPSTKKLISLKATAHQLDLSKRGVYRLIARGELPRPVKVGGASKLFETDILAYFETLQSQRSQ